MVNAVFIGGPYHLETRAIGRLTRQLFYPRDMGNPYRRLGGPPDPPGAYELLFIGERWAVYRDSEMDEDTAIYAMSEEFTKVLTAQQPSSSQSNPDT